MGGGTVHFIKFSLIFENCMVQQKKCEIEKESLWNLLKTCVLPLFLSFIIF